MWVGNHPPWISGQLQGLSTTAYLANRGDDWLLWQTIYSKILVQRTTLKLPTEFLMGAKDRQICFPVWWIQGLSPEQRIVMFTAHSRRFRSEFFSWDTICWIHGYHLVFFYYPFGSWSLGSWCKKCWVWQLQFCYMNNELSFVSDPGGLAFLPASIKLQQVNELACQ